MLGHRGNTSPRELAFDVLPPLKNQVSTTENHYWSVRTNNECAQESFTHSYVVGKNDTATSARFTSVGKLVSAWP